MANKQDRRKIMTRILAGFLAFLMVLGMFGTLLAVLLSKK